MKTIELKDKGVTYIVVEGCIDGSCMEFNTLRQALDYAARWYKYYDFKKTYTVVSDNDLEDTRRPHVGGCNILAVFYAV